MRPQFHHIDAHAEQDRVGRTQNPSMGGARMGEARAIHMTVKSAIDGEEESTDTMAERIFTAQAEGWISHKFIDEDNTEAWEAYNQHLFVGTKAGIEDAEELLMKTTKLASMLDDQEYLDTISAPRDATKLSKSKKSKEVKKDAKGKEVEASSKEADSDSTLDLDDSESETEEDASL
jgi:DNA-directed RNA polymerase-3 subunit RPC5